MAKISSMMDIGKRAMMNSQSALHTVGHNIANKNTEGYSRQRVEVQTADAVGEGNLRFGTGAKMSAVTRIVNPQLEKQIGNEKNALGFLNGQNEGMVRVEQVYNEQLVEGLNSSISKFFNAFRELSNNPENMASRTLVGETANYMSSDFNRAHDQLVNIRKDLDQQIAVHINDVNEMTHEVATLNEKIQAVEMTGAHANDERDTRDQLLKKLGEKINIRWAEGKDGQVTITAGNTAVLVSGRDVRELAVAGTPAAGNKGEGNFDILYQANPGTTVNVTSQITGGQTGGLIKVRDEFIHEMLGGLDTMASSIGRQVNEFHSSGYNAYNQTGVPFFHIPGGDEKAAQSIKVSSEILNDSAKIAVAGNPNAPGDNSIANLISDLQFKKFMGPEGNSSIDEFYNATVGRVGVVSHRLQSEADTQQNIVNQLTNIRESISGVNLDEETTKMIEFQKAYDASARLIRTADEMLETVLNLKRY